LQWVGNYRKKQFENNVAMEIVDMLNRVVGW
jgi:hypothetical protein